MRSLITALFLLCPMLFSCRTAHVTEAPQEGAAEGVANPTVSAQDGTAQEASAGKAMDLSEFHKTILYQNVNTPAQPTDQRIAVIGGGAAGLAAAHYLKKKGYPHVTVYEKESRAGGKVYSYPVGRHIYELGAFWAGETYPTVLELADYYHARYEKDPFQHYVESSPGKGYPFQNSFFVDGRPLLLLPALIGLETVYLRFGRDIKKAGFDGIHPDLFLDTESFAKKYGIKVITDAFAPFWIGCGYGYYEQTPAIYVMKLMLPALATSIKDSFKQLSLNGWNAGLYRFPEGYSSLFDKIAAGTTDLRLSSPVTQVRRVTEGGKTVVQVTAGGKTLPFDKIIIATDLRVAGQFLDVSTEERNLFAEIKSEQYNSYLIEMNGVKYATGKVVFFAQNVTPGAAGHIVALADRYDDSAVWNVLQVVPYDMSASQAAARLNQDLDRLNSGPRRIVKQVPWNYFPHVSTAALRAGFYDRMAALQGKNGTYYIGAIMNLETVESTTAFAKDLVMRRF